jgi:hypothetical protein
MSAAKSNRQNNSGKQPEPGGCTAKVKLNTNGKPVGTTVRPGQRKPYRKATLEEQARRVEYVAHLLVKEKTRCEIHRLVKHKFDIEYLQCDLTYVKRAKEWLKARCSITAAQAKMKGLNVLVDILRKGSNGDRLRAERRLAEIFGYDAPRKMEVTGKDGEPMVLANAPVRILWPHETSTAEVGGNGRGESTQIEDETGQAVANVRGCGKECMAAR